jgi:transposase-like protein
MLEGNAHMQHEDRYVYLLNFYDIFYKFGCMFYLGGPGRIVEIDETSVKKKSKYGRGKQHPDCWLFGGVDRTTKKWFGILTYESRTKSVLLPIIKEHVLPGTIIYSDMWSAYIKESKTKSGQTRTHSLENNALLGEMKYTHQWVCHDDNFVDPVTGVHTNEIEGVWEIRVKRFAKQMRGVKKELLPSYLDEFLWRSWFFNAGASKADSFEGLIIGIRRHYPVA